MFNLIENSDVMTSSATVDKIIFFKNKDYLIAILLFNFLYSKITLLERYLFF